MPEEPAGIYASVPYNPDGPVKSKNAAGTVISRTASAQVKINPITGKRDVVAVTQSGAPVAEPPLGVPVPVWIAGLAAAGLWLVSS